MALATIDETGLHLPDYPTVLEDVKARFRGIYGDDLYLGPDSQDGQLCAVFALALHDAYTLAGSVYNAYSPATAQGTGLSRMVKINGLRRKPSGRQRRRPAPCGAGRDGHPGRHGRGRRRKTLAAPRRGGHPAKRRDHRDRHGGGERGHPGRRRGHRQESSRPPGAGSPWATPPRPCPVPPWRRTRSSGGARPSPPRSRP